MKTRGALMTRIIMGVLLCGILSYLAYYGFTALRDPFSTVKAVAYTVENTVSVTGFVIRDEITLSSDAEYLDIQAAEGEKVAKGGTVARSYSSAAALERQTRIDELTLSVSQLDSVMSAGTDPAAAARLDTGIRGSILDINRAVASGDASEVGAYALTLRSLVLSRAEIFSGSGEVDALRARLQSELAALQRQSSGEGRDINTEYSGIFSAQTDGYEGILSSAVLDKLDCPKLDSCAVMTPAAAPGVFGKCITGIRWYFAAAVAGDVADYFTEGATVPLRFLGGYTGALGMRVEKVGAPEADGRCLLVLSTTEALSATTALRHQTAEIIRETYAGLRIPKDAVRVSEDGKTGVYILSGLQARFREVQPMSELDEYLIVADGKNNADALHAGDDVILDAKGLYDGKVVKEE